MGDRSAGLPNVFSSFYGGSIPTVGSPFSPGSGAMPGSIPTLGSPWNITSPTSIPPIDPDSDRDENTSTAEEQNSSMTYTMMRYADQSHLNMTQPNSPFFSLRTDKNIPTSNRQGVSAVTVVNVGWVNNYLQAKYADGLTLLLSFIESVAHEALSPTGHFNNTSGTAVAKPSLSFKLGGTKDDPSAQLTRRTLNSNNEEYFRYRGPATTKSVTKKAVESLSGSHVKDLSEMGYVLWSKMRMRFGNEHELFNMTNPDLYNQRLASLIGRSLPVAGYAEDVDGKGIHSQNSMVEGIPVLIDWNAVGPMGGAKRFVLGQTNPDDKQITILIAQGAFPGVKTINQAMTRSDYEEAGVGPLFENGDNALKMIKKANEFNDLLSRAMQEVGSFLKKSFSAGDVQSTTGATGSPLPFLLGPSISERIVFHGVVDTVQENAEGRSLGGSPFSNVPTVKVIKYRLSNERNFWGAVLRSGRTFGFLVTRRFVGTNATSGVMRRVAMGEIFPEGVCWAKHLLFKELVENNLAYNLGNLRPSTSDYNPLNSIASMSDYARRKQSGASKPPPNNRLDGLIDHSRTKNDAFWNENPRYTKTAWMNLTEREKTEATLKFYDSFAFYPCINDDMESLNEHYGYPDIFGCWQKPIFRPVGYAQHEYIHPNYPYGKMMVAMGLSARLGEEPADRFRASQSLSELPLVRIMVL
jgi:hypothetical protein